MTKLQTGAAAGAALGAAILAAAVAAPATISISSTTTTTILLALLGLSAAAVLKILATRKRNTPATPPHGPRPAAASDPDSESITRTTSPTRSSSSPPSTATSHCELADACWTTLSADLATPPRASHAPRADLVTVEYAYERGLHHLLSALQLNPQQLLCPAPSLPEAWAHGWLDTCSSSSGSTDSDANTVVFSASAAFGRWLWATLCHPTQAPLLASDLFELERLCRALPPLSTPLSTPTSTHDPARANAQTNARWQAVGTLAAVLSSALRPHQDRLLSPALPPSPNLALAIAGSCVGSALLQPSAGMRAFLTAAGCPFVQCARISSISSTSTACPTAEWSLPARALAIPNAHADQVAAVCFSPCGGFLASSSADATVKIWRLSTAACLGSFTAHAAAVWSVSWSGCGRYLASAGADKRLFLLPVGDLHCSSDHIQQSPPTPLPFAPHHTDWVRAVAWSADSTQLASGGNDGILAIWQASTRELVHSLGQHEGWVTSVAWSPADAGSLASASADQTVRLWRASDGHCLRVLAGHQAAVTAVAFSPDGSAVASASNDQTARVWSAASGAQQHTLRLSSRATAVGWAKLDASCAASNTAALLAVATPTHAASLWRLDSDAAATQTQQLLVPSDAQGGRQVRALACSPKAGFVASGSAGGAMELWRVDASAASQPAPASVRVPAVVLHAVRWSPCGRHLAAAVSSHHTQLLLWRDRAWDAEHAGEEVHAGVRREPRLHNLGGHQGAVLDLAWDPTAGRGGGSAKFASASIDGQVKIWRAEDGACLDTLTGHSDWVAAVSWSPDGRLLASGGLDGVLRVWRADVSSSAPGDSRLLLSVKDPHRAGINAISWSPDSGLVASGDGNGLVCLWRMPAGAAVCTFTPHGACAILALAWRRAPHTHDSDNTPAIMLASGGADGLVKLSTLSGSNMEESQELMTLPGLPQPGPSQAQAWVRALAWSPCGELLASGCAESVRVWKMGKMALAIDKMALAIDRDIDADPGRHVVQCIADIPTDGSVMSVDLSLQKSLCVAAGEHVHVWAAGDVSSSSPAILK